MRFSEIVKQSKFSSNQAKAVLNVMYTANWLEDLVRRQLKPYGISHEQYNVLRILRGNHPDTYALQQIRERMLNRWSNASRLVEKLRKKEYVTRRQSKENRRKVEIKITDKGLDLLEQIDEEVPMDSLYREGLSSEEAQTLSENLDQMREKMGEALEDG